MDRSAVAAHANWYELNKKGTTMVNQMFSNAICTATAEVIPAEQVKEAEAKSAEAQQDTKEVNNV